MFYGNCKEKIALLLTWNLSIIGEMSVAFNQKKYIELQSNKILDRASQFEKLYLEFGGKLFDDHHMSRCVPGFLIDTKIKMLLELKDKLEVILTITAEDIIAGRMRHDISMSYENYIIHLVDCFKDVGISVNSVVINKYTGQSAINTYKRKLEHRGIKVHLFGKIEGYPLNTDHILSKKGFGTNPFIKTTKPIIILTGPGAKSGKMNVALSQLYHEVQSGNMTAGFAKFETLPVWNLPLKHPINIAYEASTVNIGDQNMIDHFHFDKYGDVAVNYNRDIEAFPLLQNILRQIYGKDIYHSPTDMGVNMVASAIENKEIVERASKDEVVRRWFETMCYFKQGTIGEEVVDRMNLLMEQLSLKPTDRAVVMPMRERMNGKGTPSAALQLPNSCEKGGEIIAASCKGLMTASATVLMKSIQHLLNLPKIKMIPANILQRAVDLKTQILGNRNASLRLDEVLIILSSSAVTNDLSAMALDALPRLKGSEVHVSHIVSDEEARVWRRLGVNLTQEPMLS